MKKLDFWTSDPKAPDPEPKQQPRERPGPKLLQTLASLLATPGTAIQTAGQVAGKLMDMVLSLLHSVYTLALVAMAYFVVVWICHQAHPAGVPYLMAGSHKILLPFGKQILNLELKFHIV